MTTHGTIGPFEQGREDWTSYTERLEQYFAANGVEDAGKQRAILLSVCGAPTYQVIRNLVAPEKLTTLSFKEIVTLVREHYCPPPSEIVQRFMFNSRSQKEGETIAEFVAELRRLSEHCKFADTLEDMLRDRVVCGMRDTRLQRRLLAESDLTFKKAFEICQATELAATNARNLQVGKDLKLGGTVMAIQSGRGPSRPATTPQCYRCNSTQHLAKDCRFKTVECHKCGKKGHLAKACRSKPTQPKQPSGKKQKSFVAKTHQLASDNSSGDEEDVAAVLLRMSSTKAAPIQVMVNLDGSDVTMEVDTGASVSVMSEATFQKLWEGNRPKLNPTDVKLKTYTGEHLKVLGSIPVQVVYQEQTKSLSLLIVGGAGPTLLGRDWLKHIQLDWNRIAKLSNSSPLTLENILQQHTAVFKEELGVVQGVTAKIHADPQATPKFCKARPVPYALRGKINQELQRLEKNGIIKPVEFAEWAAPIVPVLKPDGSVRICGDYKTTVNQVAKLDTYPLPRIEDIFASLAGGKHFTKLDLAHAYQQVQLAEESQKLVVINTHKGLYAYNRLPFGIASAPAIFQRIMEGILQGVDNVTVYLDDILITGSTGVEHLHHLQEVLARLEKAGIRLKRDKCKFLLPSVEYLGHIISSEGLQPTPSKIKAIVEAPTPKDVTQLRSFLGLVNYYSKFLPRSSSLLAPLYQLLQKAQKWIWGEAQTKAFREAKEALTSSKVLTHYDPDQELILDCDASPYGVGAVLSHRFQDGSVKPVAFASRSLAPAEKKYAQLDKEALAIIFGVKKFHQYLSGRKFTIHSDHKPLQHIFDENRPVPTMSSARIQRWALTLSAYNYTIEYKPGSQHANADLLSRLPLPDHPAKVLVPSETVLTMDRLQTTPITAKQIKQWTRRDPILSQVLDRVLSGWPRTTEATETLKPYERRREELSLQDGCLLWGNRVIIPDTAQARVLEELHVGHPGISRMKGIARGIVWWPGIDKDIENAVRSCCDCQENQKAPASAPLHPWEWPEHPWTRLHIDYAGPFMGKMFLVVVDAHSKWLEIDIVPAATSAHTINKLRTMFATHGLPQMVVSDNGTVFTSAEFKEFMSNNGIRHVTSSPYHPSSNGLAERYVQTFKNAMKKVTTDDLQQQLSIFLLRYRSSPHTTTGTSPAQLLMGHRLITHLDLMRPSLSDRVRSAQAHQKQHHDQHSKERHFKVGDAVFVRNFGSGPKWITGKITACRGPVSFEVELDDGKVVRRHMDHVRRSMLPSPPNREDCTSEDITFPPPTQEAQEPEVNLDNSKDTPQEPRRSTRIRRPPEYYGVA